jgi:putative redox protein
MIFGRRAALSRASEGAARRRGPPAPWRRSAATFSSCVAQGWSASGGPRGAAGEADGAARRSGGSGGGGPAASAHGKVYAVAGSGRGASSTVHARGHELILDLSRTQGGHDRGPEPIECLLAALVGCEQATATFVARNMTPRMALSHIEFSYEADRDAAASTSLPLSAALAPGRSPALRRVLGTARVFAGRDESASRVAELRSHVESRCPVAVMLRASGCTLEVRWEFVPPREPGG